MQRHRPLPSAAKLTTAGLAGLDGGQKAALVAETMETMGGKAAYSAELVVPLAVPRNRLHISAPVPSPEPPQTPPQTRCRSFSSSVPEEAS